MAGNAKRLRKARKTRTLIAQMFAALANDQITIVEVLGDPPVCLRRIRVYDVLRRVPHLNRDGAEKVLRNAKVWPLVTLGNLDEDDRTKIIAHLPPRVKR